MDKGKAPKRKLIQKMFGSDSDVGPNRKTLGRHSEVGPNGDECLSTVWRNISWGDVRTGSEAFGRRSDIGPNREMFGRRSEVRPNRVSPNIYPLLKKVTSRHYRSKRDGLEVDCPNVSGGAGMLP